MKSQETLKRVAVVMGNMAAYHESRGEIDAFRGMFMARWLVRWILEEPLEVSGEIAYRRELERLLREIPPDQIDPVAETYGRAKKAGDN